MTITQLAVTSTVFGWLNSESIISACRAAVGAARAEALAQFVAVAMLRRRNGEIPVETDSEALARFYMAAVQGMAVQATDGVDGDTLGTLVDFALQAWPSHQPACD
ncbi:hypothetical protein [Rhizobium leguminosarum]|uniref:hypothetical protein n=1 Tax=Rhizobium leguminosarum TaxID=384 RepID=UPI0012F96DCD|nr:hypothetical protein [Rhizobium leguminosarum]